MNNFGRNYDAGFDRQIGPRERWRGNLGGRFRADEGGYDREYGHDREGEGNRWGAERFGYDRYAPEPFRERGYGAGRYNERYFDPAFGRSAYKSRYQTDYGDPFGDREHHTPIRVIRGRPRSPMWSSGYDRDYDRGYMAWDYRRDYGSEFGRAPRSRPRDDYPRYRW